MISISELTKRYGEFTALDDCSLEIPEGEIFGLLGPNGAGKTTLLRILLGFLRATSGTASILGADCYRDSVKIHEQTAYLPGDVRLFRRMSAPAYLRFVCSLRQQASLNQALELADEFDLEMDRRIAFMSTGMRQKLALVATFSAGARLVVLDEPTANLDPNIRTIVGEKVRQLAQAGTTVLFSSHVLSEVEQVCDRIAIMRLGRVATVECLAELLSQHRITAKIARADFHIDDALTPHIRILDEAEDEVTFETPLALARLLEWLARLELDDIEIRRVGLQPVYDQINPMGIPTAPDPDGDLASGEAQARSA